MNATELPAMPTLRAPPPAVARAPIRDGDA